MISVTERLAQTSLRLRGYASRRLQTSVGQLHILDAQGRGPLPPMVLLHGLSSMGVHYFQLLERLRPHVRRLIVPDLPAHGLSQAPSAGTSLGALKAGLFEALDAVIDEPAVIFGNSMGGLAAIHYALLRPERVRALILVSPAGAAMARPELDRFLDTFRIATHAGALDFIDRVLNRKTALRQLLALGVRRRIGHPTIRGLVDSVTPEDLLKPSELSGLSGPLLLVWGRRERIFLPEHLAFFRRHLPAHHQFAEPEEFGHSPYLQDPGAVARAILTFTADV